MSDIKLFANIGIMYIPILYTDDNKKYISSKGVDAFMFNWSRFPNYNFPPEYRTCFASWWAVIPWKRNLINNIIFSPVHMPHWYMELIDDVNKEFKNIKVMVLKEKDSTAYVFDDGVSRLSKNDSNSGWAKLVREETFKTPMFTFDLSDEYIHRQNLVHSLTTLIRLISLGEGFISSTEKYPNTAGARGLEYLAWVNNKNITRSRNFSEIPVTVEKIKLLDKPDIVNTTSKKDSFRTSWMSSFSNSMAHCKIIHVDSGKYLRYNFTEYLTKYRDEWGWDSKTHKHTHTKKPAPPLENILSNKGLNITLKIDRTLMNELIDIDIVLKGNRNGLEYYKLCSINDRLITWLPDEKFMVKVIEEVK